MLEVLSELNHVSVYVPFKYLCEVFVILPLFLCGIGNVGDLGTENLCRVMVEGPEQDIVQGHAETIATAVRRAIGLADQ